MRIGFTIIYNGEHHLKHKNYGDKLPKMLDYWIIVEGFAQPGGSTSWCNNLHGSMSTDHTWFNLMKITKKHKNVRIVSDGDIRWSSKDDMVNMIMSYIRYYVPNLDLSDVFLWQIDVDEQWTRKQMDTAEKDLLENCCDCGCFHANHFVGDNLVAKGCWGEGNDPEDPLKNAYRRLWRWKGQNFETHEPPKLQGGNGHEVLLSQKFNHYSYYFAQDILFKSKYYGGYESLYENWYALKKETEFPQPINRLIPGHWGETNTKIVKFSE